MSKISLEPNDSGAGTFTLAAPNSNTNRTLTLPDASGNIIAADASTGRFDSSNMPAGSVIQVVYARPSLPSTTISSSTYQDSGLEASITPTSTTSKILVQWAIHARSLNDDEDNGGSFRILRNGTEVTSDTPDFIGFSGELDFSTVTAVDIFLDSPSTESSVTYKVQARNRNGAPKSINLHVNSRAEPSMVLMEIAG